jgi:hypothetical protein
MHPTNQGINKSRENYDSEALTLEQIDIIVRKCHHLHDEEVLASFTRFFRMLKTLLGQKKWAHHEPVK